jgi:hypothetical protein
MNDLGGELAARLHSRHRPQLEAARYIEALNLGGDIDCFILIEPGMGYLIPALRERFPGSTVIALHADNYFRLTQSQYPEVPMWFPGSATSVQEFLEETIPEAASARLIEWRPSLRVYGDVCLSLVREATEFIRRSAASRRTSAVFGKRWVRNFFRNLALVNQTLLYRTMDMPVIITGSGPSLESALPQIRAAREGVFVLAASSSLPALMTGGIIPDMVITTDGGAWALLHLHACFRSFNTLSRRHGGHKGHGEENKILNSPCPPCLREMNSDIKLAFALSAALPSQCAGVWLLPMNDGSLWQSMALHGIGLPSVLVPQRGTVTASALDLALVLSSGNIFLAGMDLAVRDIRSHARPYGFDHLFFGTASRLRPVYSQRFARSDDMRAGGSHDVYAAWFKNKIASWPKRVFSLGGNHAAFEDNLPTAPLTMMAHNVADCFKIVTTNYSPEDRRGRAVDTLIAALDNPQYAAELTGELAPLLFPARCGVSPLGVPPVDVQPAEIAETLSLYGRSLHG